MFLLVFPERLAHLAALPLDVEDIVRHLKEDAERGAEFLHRRFIPFRNGSSHHERRADELRRLVFIDKGKLLFARIFIAFAGKIQKLPRDHTLRPRGMRQKFGGAAVRSILCRRHGEHKRFAQQCVARQNGIALAELFMAGRLAAAQIVVVHRGQVIVDEGISMDALERQSKRVFPLPLAAERIERRKKEDGPQPLPACKQGIAHGIRKPARAGKPRAIPFEHALEGGQIGLVWTGSALIFAPAPPRHRCFSEA